MSARLIKNGERISIAAFAPLVFTDSVASDEPGKIMPFTPRPASGLPPSQELGLMDGHEPARANNQSMSFEAETILREAQAEAARLLVEARAQAAEVERQARERGLTEARIAAEAESSRAIEPLREQLARTIEEVSTLRADISAHAERDLVRLAIEVAKKIVHREVTADSEVALTLARVVLARVHNRALAKLHLHPDDYAYISEHTDRLPSGSCVELVEDRAVGRGGCFVETDMGDTDARIERQFEEIERSFLAL